MTSKPSEAPPSLEFWVQRFLDHMRYERQQSPRTIENYQNTLTAFTMWAKKHTPILPLDFIQLDHIRSFFIELQSGRKKRTLHNYASALRSFFRYVLAYEGIRKNPMVGLRLPKLERQLPQFLGHTDIERLLEAPLQYSQTGRNDLFQAQRDQIILELLYAGGFRVSELVSLNYGQIDWHSGVIRVIGKGNKERLCPVYPKVLELLKVFAARWMGGEPLQDLPVVINTRTKKRLSVRQVQTVVKKYLRYLALPANFSTHKLRHTYATHLLNNGADLRTVQELLGHKQLSSTQIYTHLDAKRLKAVHAQAHPRG